jgi:alpha-1,2-mannosyltransferase
VPPATSGSALDFDRHFRRLVWVGASLIVIASAIAYSSKAAEDRSAFIRWRHQVREFWGGVNIYDTMMFPNPPIMPLTLSPFMMLPPVTGALCWFGFKVALTVGSVWICFGIIKPGDRPIPSWVQAGIMFFSLRPFLSDLNHGNNNLVIMFLVVASLQAWRKGYDVLAGLILALAISYKVTPALFVPYYMYKRSWRTVGATLLGMGLFLLVVPSMIIGPKFNGECLAMWWHRILSPYLTKSDVGDAEINQSMVGVLSRLLIAPKQIPGQYDSKVAVNLVSWAPATVKLLIKGLSVLLVGLLALFCRTKAAKRTDPRLLGEIALVLLTMLFVSERSWKHHYVTLLVPFTYLMYEFSFAKIRTRSRVIVAIAIWVSMGLMATTSSEIGGHFHGGQGHKIALGYGMFLWAGVVLYAAIAWRVLAERNREPEDRKPAESTVTQNQVRGPHFSEARRRAISS